VTGVTRTALAPTLPTLAEEIGLKDFGVVAWMGIFGPANLPAPIVEGLSAELLRLLALPEIQERIVAMGADPTPAGPPEFAAFVRQQLAVWERQIRIAGMQPQ
jgi:tripartite-type tricarboxylate transporter receptor subunit TctC